MLKPNEEILNQIRKILKKFNYQEFQEGSNYIFIIKDNLPYTRVLSQHFTSGITNDLTNRRAKYLANDGIDIDQSERRKVLRLRNSINKFRNSNIWLGITKNVIFGKHWHSGYIVVYKY